jgi:hypothetical protein
VTYCNPIRLADMIRQRNLTQTEAAKRLGLTGKHADRSLRRYLTGDRLLAGTDKEVGRKLGR